MCTPKAYNKVRKIIEERDDLKQKLGANDIEVVACIEIYMNLMDPTWTEDRCDDTVYFIPKSQMEE